MKTILHITECLGSGVLNYVKNITKWQVEDYKVVLAYSTRPETPEDFKTQFDDRVVFIKVEGFTREIEPRNDLKAYFHIRRILREVKPDLIHLHSTKAGVLGRWAALNSKYKVLYSPHAYSFLMMDCSEGKRKLYKFIERLSDKRNCLTVADIDSEYEACLQVAGNAVCIPNGIEIEEVESIRKDCNASAEREGITICTLGKVVPQKDPVLFNEIAMALPQYKFVWIGAGPMENVLTGSNISVTGWVSRKEAFEKILSSDIFLFTSAWESLSIALMEAMYLGKPCVVSRADGNRDVICSDNNGFVCSEKNEYVEALKVLASDKEKREKYGKQAHSDIIEKYNTQVMEKKYRKLFEKLGI